MCNNKQIKIFWRVVIFCFGITFLFAARDPFYLPVDHCEKQSIQKNCVVPDIVFRLVGVVTIEQKKMALLMVNGQSKMIREGEKVKKHQVKKIMQDYIELAKEGKIEKVFLDSME